MMDDYVVNCRDIDESALVGSSIRKVIEWAVDGVMAHERSLVIMGEPGSGKTTALLLIMSRLRRLGIPVAYINTYNELGLRPMKIVNCNNDSNANVLLIDDLDVVFTVPKLATAFIDRVIRFNGTVIASLTVPLLISNELEPLEPLVKFLHSSLRASIEYHYDDLRVFAQRLGVSYVKQDMRTPGMILRNFRKWGNNKRGALNNVLSDSNVTL